MRANMCLKRLKYALQFVFIYKMFLVYGIINIRKKIHLITMKWEIYIKHITFKHFFYGLSNSLIEKSHIRTAVVTKFY